MKVLGILGSPRKGGNTEKLLDEALRGAASAGAEPEKVILSELRISGCDECDACRDTGDCSKSDDMEPLYEKLLSAGGVIVASPIFFYGLTSQTKAFIDRCQALWQRKYSLNEEPAARCGLFISTSGGQGARVFEGSLLTMRYFFDVIGVKDFDRLLYKGTDPNRALIEFSVALNDSYKKGRNLPACRPKIGKA